MDFENISLNGLCNVFAAEIAKKEDLEIFMIYHENPEWDYENQSIQEIENATTNDQFMIIHCVIADKSGNCFDAGGYIYDYDDDKTLTVNDINFYEKLTKIIRGQCEHGDEYTDPLSIDEFNSKELSEIIEKHPEKYLMNKMSDILEQDKIPDYLRWIHAFQLTK